MQTLSRLNRTHPEKTGTMVLDFADEADEIKAAFEPCYETTMLSEATDPNLLYEIQTRLAAFPVYVDPDVESFAKIYFDPKATQDRLYAVLAPVVQRFGALPQAEQHDFRGQLTDYVRLYAFLAQVLTFADADLEKLYVFARHLRRLLPADREELPREVTTIGVSLLPRLLAAGVITGGSGSATFDRRVQEALAILARSEDPAIRELHAAVVAAPVTIKVRPITDDRATWHADGDRLRGHTEPVDARPKNEGRASPTNASCLVPRPIRDRRLPGHHPSRHGRRADALHPHAVRFPAPCLGAYADTGEKND